MEEQPVDERLQETAYQSYLTIAKKLLEGKLSPEEFAKEQTERKVKELKDPLTNLFNRRFFDQEIVLEVARAIRQKEPLSLIMLDVDDFKKINDTHGHPAGDEVLRVLGKLINDNVRKGDVAARYGGEEIAILLPNTQQEGAEELAERLLKEVHNAKVVVGEKQISFTASIGIGDFRKDMTAEKLVENADAALYQAKEKGKDRIEIYG